MASQQTSIVGVFDRVRWRADDSDFVIAFLLDNTIIKGKAADGELTPNLTYEFFGRWKEHSEHGKQFEFVQFQLKEPHSRHGVVAYLQRYAPGVGPAIGGLLWDAFAGEAVKVLRLTPELASKAIPRLTPERAKRAAEALQSLANLEDTKIQLTNLFAGRGFPGLLVDECIAKWRILAPARIKRDPFCLLVEEMSGCGFARCDKLYTDLGLPLGRLKRQVICLWYVLHSDSSGHTWIDADHATGKLGEYVSGAPIQRRKAILCAVRAGWLAKRRDDAGKLWLAEGERAANEAYLAKRLVELGQEVEIAVPTCPPSIGAPVETDSEATMAAPTSTEA